MTATTTNNNNTTVVLLGDSTLDNDYWVNADETVTYQVGSLLAKHNTNTINLAMDGWTVDDVLHGNYKDKAVSSAKHCHEFYEPLKELARRARDVEVTHIVLSVGGNNLREQLEQVTFASQREREILIEELIAHVQKLYVEVLDRITLIVPNARITLMLQYAPLVSKDQYGIYYLMEKMVHQKTIKNGLFSMLDFGAYFVFGRRARTTRRSVAFLYHIMTRVYGPIIATARERGYPVIDMASTLDCRNSALYTCQIEPSKDGAAIMAELIAHVMSHHDFNGKSVIYRKPGCTIGPVLGMSADQPWCPHSPGSTDPDDIRTYFDLAYTNRFGQRSVFLETNPTLVELVQHAQTSSRSRRVMQELGWITEENQVASDCLRRALAQ